MWTSNPAGTLRVLVQRRSQVSRYSFGTGTAVFRVRGRCGVTPVVTSLIDDQLYAVVSVNAFTNVLPALLRRAPASFESEALESRLARRKRNWIAAVRFEEQDGS